MFSLLFYHYQLLQNNAIPFSFESTELFIVIKCEPGLRNGFGDGDIGDGDRIIGCGNISCQLVDFEVGGLHNWLHFPIMAGMVMDIFGALVILCDRLLKMVKEIK